MINENKRLQLTFTMAAGGNKTVNILSPKSGLTLPTIQTAIAGVVNSQKFVISRSNSDAMYATGLYSARYIETNYTDITE